MTSNVSSAAVKVVSGSQLIADGTTENISEKKIPEGTYEVTVSKEGYVSVTQSVVVKGGEITTVPVTLVLEADKVVGITSDNLKTFDIEFSKPVDEKTITNESLKIYEDDKSAALNNSGSFGNYSYILSDDNKTLKIVINKNDYTQLTKYKVVVEGIKTKDTKKEFEKAEKEIELKDTTPATVNNIEITSKKTVKVYYSEPMHLDKDQTMVLDNELKINGSQVLKSRGAFDIKDNSVVYTLDKPLTTGTYEVSTEGAKDYAGWKTAETKKTVSYVVKTTAPSIVSATAKEKNKISVEFSAPLDTSVGIIKLGKGYNATFDLSNKSVNPADNAADNANTVVYYDLPSLSEAANRASAYVAQKRNVNVYKNLSIVKISDTKYDFYFGSDYALDKADVVESVIKYDKIKDLDEQEVKSEQTFKFQADNDNDIPTITEVKPEGQKLVIKFSEAMDRTEATKNENYEFKTKTGVKVFNPNGVIAYDSYNNAVTLTFKSDDVSNAGGTFSMTVKNLKDASVRGNDMATFTKDVTFADTKAPKVSKVEVKAGDGAVISQKLIVSFDKPMNKESIENLSNYILTFGDKAEKTVLSNWSVNGKKATVEAGKGNLSATITLGGLVDKDVNAGSGIKLDRDKLTILGVKDSLGNVYTDVDTAYLIKNEYSDSVDEDAIDIVELTSRNTVKVTLKDGQSVFASGSAYASEFVLKDASGDLPKDVQPIKAEISSDNKSVTLTLNGNIDPDSSANNYKLYIKPKAGDPQTRNVAGQFFDIDSENAISLTDKAAPSVDRVMSAAKAKEVDSTTYSSVLEDCIVVRFDENVKIEDEAINVAIIPTLFTVKVDDTTLNYVDKDYEVTLVNGTDITSAHDVNTNSFLIKIKKSGINSKIATVALKNDGYLKDAKGNKANAFAAKSVEMKNDKDVIKETTAPYVKTKLNVAGPLSTGDYKLEFSEELNDYSKNSVEQMVKNALSATGEDNSFEVKWAGSTLNIKVTGSVTLSALDPGASFTVKDILENSSEKLDVGALQN